MPAEACGVQLPDNAPHSGSGHFGIPPGRVTTRSEGNILIPMRCFHSGGNVIRLMSLSTFLILTSNIVHAQPPAAGRQAMVALYAAVGPELKTYILDVGAARLLEQGSVTLPQNVQEAWPHPSRRYLYVTWSNNMGGKAGQQHQSRQGQRRSHRTSPSRHDGRRTDRGGRSTSRAPTRRRCVYPILTRRRSAVLCRQRLAADEAGVLASDETRMKHG